MNARLDAALAHWSYVAPLLTPPKTDAEYAALVESLDAILDAGGADESHPLAGLAVMVGDLLSAYEAVRTPMPEAATPAMVLAHLMEAHGMKQADLPELRGKRAINLRQAKALANRFGVGLEIFA
jgi:HTH-type transcriptional regulator / antitoxin HigA